MNNNQSKILNVFACIGIITAIVQAIVFLIFVKGSLLVFVCALIAFVYGIVFILNNWINQSYAKLIYFIFTIPSISGLDWLIDHQIDIHLYYIPFTIIIFMLYDIESDRRKIGAMLFLEILSYCFFEFLLPNTNLIHIPIVHAEFLYNLNVLCCFLLTLFATYNFVIIIKIVEKGLKESKARLSDVFENSNAAIFYIDVNHKLQLFNENAKKEVKQYLNIELKSNESIFNFLPTSLHEEFRNHLNIALDGKSIKYDKEIKTANGISAYYENSFSPVYNNNEIIGVTSKGINVTDKIRAELELQQRTILNETFFDAAPDALFLVDVKSKKIVSLNRFAAHRFTILEYKEMSYLNLFDGSPNQVYWNKVENYLAIHQIWSQEILCVTTQGKSFLGDVYIKLFDLVNQPHYIIRISDISNKENVRENQREFLQLKKQVTQEIDRRENLNLIIQGQELERQRISQELHDGLGQILTATRLKIASLKYKEDVNFYDDKEQIKALLDKVIAEIKLISNNLMPTGLDDLGLIDALENMFSLFPPTVKITFDYGYSIKNLILSQNQKISLFRIIQEAVNNAVKHANNSEIFVCIGMDEQILYVEVYDHGIGFDYSGLNTTNKLSNGLNNMKERASLIHATFELETKINKGTKITILLNLNQNGNN